MVDDCVHIHRCIKKCVPIFQILEAYIYSQTWLSIKGTAIFNMYVHPPRSVGEGGGWLTPLPNFQKLCTWNWENFTKNLVTFKKDKIGCGMKNFNILKVHWKIGVLGEAWGEGRRGFTRSQYIDGLPKKGGLDSFQI